MVSAAICSPSSTTPKQRAFTGSTPAGGRRPLQRSKSFAAASSMRFLIAACSRSACRASSMGGASSCPGTAASRWRGRSNRRSATRATALPSAKSSPGNGRWKRKRWRRILRPRRRSCLRVMRLQRATSSATRASRRHSTQSRAVDATPSIVAPSRRPSLRT